MILASLEFETGLSAWIWLAIVLLVLAGVFGSYRALLRGSEFNRLVWVLLVFRLAGLTALLIMLAKPVWNRTVETVDPGRVAIVVDNSRSMSLADVSGQSRYTLARSAAQKLKQGLEDNSPGARLAVDFFDIRGEAVQGDLPTEPHIERTALVQALKRARASESSRRLAALVLISDGMNNAQSADFHELVDARVPVHTIGFLAPPQSEGFDLAISAVQAPQRALIHNEIVVEVAITKTGQQPTPATVVLKRAGEEFASQSVVFGTGPEEQKVRLKFTPSQPGSFVFTARVSAPTGERLLSNNSKQFPLRVDKEAIRVLYIEGFLRYEYKYLKSRLEEDPDVSLVSVVRRANPELIGARAQEDLVSADRLKSFDVVILGDMESTYLGEGEYQALLRWIEQGHALLVLGGYHSFGPNGFRSTPLADALPVVFADKEPLQTEEPFVLKLTEEGARHPVFDVSGGRENSGVLWQAAPPLAGASLVDRAKPGATILAVNPNIVTAGKPSVVMAVQRYGSGQTLVLTADTTWRWTRLTRVLGQSDTLYARFWSQMIRWLAGRGQDNERALLTLSTDKPDYAVGKPVTIRAVRQPRPTLDLSGIEPTVEVEQDGGKKTTVEMRASSADPNAFSGSFTPSIGGHYQVEANLGTGGKPLANQTAEFLVYGSELELADPGTNRPYLQSLAMETGGTYADIENAADLLSHIDRSERRTVREVSTELWHSSFLFLFFLAALTAEWILRRRHRIV